MDPIEPHLQGNSSFSPPSRRWDLTPRSDGLSHGTHGAHITGSSLSSHSKASLSLTSSNPYPNHHHSVSDGALSYSGSLSDNFHVSRWTPPVQRYDLGEFSTPTGGARPGSSVLAQCNESSVAGLSSVSNSFGSASPASESSRRASTSKQPIFFPPRNFPGRRSFMSKPVYPLGFRNPVDEVYGLTDASASSRMAHGDNRTSPASTVDTSSPELKFHKALTELQRTEASPEAGTSSRREGFRWSNASSYEFGMDGDTIDIAGHSGLDSLKSPNTSSGYLKCWLCERFLWQKSPWSSHRIIRNGDMPIAGILPCHHVFHAECLEENTPSGQPHEPPCPVCLKTVSGEGSISFSEHLEVPRRSLCRSQRAKYSHNGEGSSSNPIPDQKKDDKTKRTMSLPMLRRGGSLMKNNLKRFSFKGKVGKDLFGGKIFGRARSSSSSLLIHENNSQSGHSKTRQSRLSGP